LKDLIFFDNPLQFLPTRMGNLAWTFIKRLDYFDTLNQKYS